MPVKTLRVVLPDQLTPSLSSLADATPDDVILFMEVKHEGIYVPHHPQKIVLIVAAMRQFAAQLAAQGLQVRYIKLNDPTNTHSFTGEITRATTATGATRVVATWPGEWRVLNDLHNLQKTLTVPLEILPDTRFISTPADFAAWATGRKQLRMEYFYRLQRERTGLLMTGGDKPEGGEWNYDKENREPYKAGPLSLPPYPTITEPETTAAVVAEVKALVAATYPTHFGAMEPFRWATTRTGALQVLEHFITERLPHFGRFQDAMVADADFMFHSLISPYLNIGLLEPLEICQAAEAAHHAGEAPLAAVEGFIRQIIGWREYVRGLYWHLMPGYAQHNYLEATRPLPAFYWDETKTDMACMSQAIGATRRNAYAHHIQRLMVTGNFALLAGIDIKHITDWYLAVYADAFEWVELPNTLGMALFADGGIMASKPYAASGRYINKMSNYCGTCRYKPDENVGPNACPFSTLYWHFMLRNYPKLQNNPRLGPILAQVRNMDDAKRVQIIHQGDAFLESIAPQPKA